jgi:hypothetical protein
MAVTIIILASNLTPHQSANMEGHIHSSLGLPINTLRKASSWQHSRGFLSARHPQTSSSPPSPGSEAQSTFNFNPILVIPICKHETQLNIRH